MKKITIFLALCIAGSTSGFPDVITVPDNVPTIQGAIISALPGDTVLVKPGTYHEVIDYQGKQLVVGSLFLTTGDTSYIAQTIISAPSNDPVVTFENGETELSKLVGFTITNGKGKLDAGGFFGGGIYCSYAHPTLDHLLITGNVAPGLGGCGGGIYFRESNAMVRDCVILGNEAGMGAGIRCDGCNLTIIRTWFKDNFAVSSGGGLMFYLSASSRVECCTFTGNSGVYGGAICCNNSSPVIDRITSYHNSGGYGGTLNLEASQPKLLNSILWENSINPQIVNEIFMGSGPNSLLVAYCDIMGSDTAIHGPGLGGVHWLEGNIEIYPEFNDPLVLDLTLPEQSPCVNEATALYIYNGDTLVNITDFSGSAPEMGAYEFIPAVFADPRPIPESKLDFEVLDGNSPGEKKIRFYLPESRSISLSVFDMSGRIISHQAGKVSSAGEHYITLNCSMWSAATYVVRLTAGMASTAKKFVTADSP